MTEDVSTTTNIQLANSSSYFTTTKTSWGNISTTSDLRQNCTLDDSSLQLPLAIMYSLLFVLGLIGNLLALWVFFCVHSKKNSIRVFLINIAFADLLLVVCLPFRILYHSQGNIWVLGPTLCKVVGNLFYMNMYISITLLGLISVDRNLKIHRGAGMQRKLHTTRWSNFICAVVWFAALTTILMFLFSKNNSEINRLVPSSLTFQKTK